jgi:hypothetical protein
MAIANDHGALFVFDPRLGTTKQIGTIDKGECRLAFSPDGSQLATWSGSSVTIFDVSSGSEANKISNVSGSPSSLRYSAAGFRIACGSTSGKITVIDSAKGAIEKQLSLKGRIALAAFDASGQGLTVISSDKHLRHIPLSTGVDDLDRSLVQTVAGADEPDITEIGVVDATPDCSIIAVGAKRELPMANYWSSLVKLIDATGRTLHILAPLGTADFYNEGVSISSDGRFVMSRSEKGFMVWPTHGGLPLLVTNKGDLNMHLSAAADFDGGSYAFSTAGDIAKLVVVEPETPRDPVASASRDGVNMSFIAPTEQYPVVNQAVVDVAFLATGCSDQAVPSVHVAGRPSMKKVTLAYAESRDLMDHLEAEPAVESTADGPVAVKTPEGVKFAVMVCLTPGPNKVEITLRDGNKEPVQISKVITYVPVDSETRPSYGASHALVIGIDDYKSVPKLRCAVSDADAFKQVLISKYGFKAKDIVELRNGEATAARIRDELNNMIDSNNVSPSDRVVIFFSGHGHGVENQDGTMVGFLIPQDAEIDPPNLNNFAKLSKSCIDMQGLAQLERESPAKHILVFLDACFSGIAAESKQGYSELLTQGDARKLYNQYFYAREIITASRENEEARERFKESGAHGFFTQALLEYMGTQNQPFLAQDLFNSVKSRVQQLNADQHPRMARFSDGPGDMIFAPATNKE